MKRRSYLILSLVSALATVLIKADAETGPTYTLGSPMPSSFFDTTDETENAWLAANPVFVATAGYVNETAKSIDEKVDSGLPRYSLTASEAGFAWERAKPEYYLTDLLDAPADVDWNATHALYNELQAQGREQGFLFNTDETNPGVYAVQGGNQTFSWVLKDGATNEITYVVAMNASGRPRRIFWTDAPFNAPPVSLEGKFVKFFGNPELLTLKYDTTVSQVGGMEVTNQNRIVSGLYVDGTAHLLYAAGQLSGQCVMAYYDTGNFENILSVQVVEVCRPEVIPQTGTIGEALKPTGQGYPIDGLVAQVTAGLSNSDDNRGPYLYQHAGQYSYSPKHKAVFPLRPTVGQRWKDEIYWMETDAMGVRWPFELNQYECDWPDETDSFYVRGNISGDPGAKIYIPKDYTAALESYQEPEGHARAVDGNNAFFTTGEGWSLLRLTADDNIWFMPVRSVLRTNADYFTLKPSRVTVGHELMLRSGSRSGLAEGVVLHASSAIPGYLYKAASGDGYDVNLYHPVTNATSTASAGTGEKDVPSALYAISTDGPLEVWWSRTFQPDDMPYPIDIPVLPQVFKPVWPQANEMPQIVIASQQGSANRTIHQQGGAAYFDSEVSLIFLAERVYFGRNEGTVGFWTRASVYPDASVTNAPSALLGFKSDAMTLRIGEGERLEVLFGTDVAVSAPLPANMTSTDWLHVALTFKDGTVRLYLNGALAGTGEADTSVLSGYLRSNSIGLSGLDVPVAIGRQVAELVTYRTALEASAIDELRYTRLTGNEGNLTSYYTFERGRDLNSELQVQDVDVRECYERVHGTKCLAIDVALTEPGPPAWGTGVISSEKPASVYYQNDKSLPGYNPNEEHAFVRNGSGGQVAWALRTDLNTTNAPPPAVFVEYTAGGRAKLQMFEVVLTNETWSVLGADCTAGRILPGPHPLDLFDDPWLPEDYWDAGSGPATGPAYRDRKGQLWARAAGTLPIYMYYRQQEGFWFPTLAKDRQPAVGQPIPWLALLDPAQHDPLAASPAKWTWNVSWPAETPVLRIGQTLTVAADGLPEVWGAKSMSVVFPDPDEAPKTVELADPTTVVSLPFAAANLSRLGFSTDNNGGLAMRSGKYYFTELPPHLSSRFYVDSTNDRMCFTGVREASAAGVSVLYPNVLSANERALIKGLVPADVAAGQKEAYAAWTDALDKLAVEPIRPTATDQDGNEVTSAYMPADHYSLTALGATNYVVLIENDAPTTNYTAVVDGVAQTVGMGVTDGDPISMHVLRVTNDYYRARVVSREDEVNLLSQRLSVLYTDPFGGHADDFEFEWRKAKPNADGTIPDAYDDGQVYQVRPYSVAPGTKYADAHDARITIGEQGDTLEDMVNSYWICRYKARKGTPAYATMGDAWSGWCAPPALAEGWVQRVLNNITPFNQRMTDLYANPAETVVSMIQQAGAPYQGDVALNQDNIKSVGLIQLYETLLNKAESMSLLLGVNDTDANKQLMLAAERLCDLYTLLGDEAYSDAKNPTIGFGSNMAQVDNQPAVDFGALSTSLFCFDNQVRSLLDEELALLRGRTGESAPVMTLPPYYNRLLWNFTRGITAGEVAYAVNYNISGVEKTALSEEQAARIYPQGHGDAYGHYLSALKGWYRLLRNPNFSWARAQGEMNVADAAVNVDYYEEAKFAASARNLAKTAADVVDLTARKSWRDNDGDLNADYEDEDGNRAFGSGEWANRGAYGALVNWVAANSLLPPHEEKEGLNKIDRDTVGELDEICTCAANIQRASDRNDAMLNPLGLADTAIPFDITPIGAADGTATHFEQIRARAATTLENAQKALDDAQEYSNRLRMIQESADNYEIAVGEQEAAFTKELIGYYGMPYSDDIGAGKTYPQGYEGPDLVHYMWMDLAKFGLKDVDDTIRKQTVKYTDVASRISVATLKGHMDEQAVTDLTYDVSANGLVLKPANITGTRVTQGSIQEKYADFLLQYMEVKNAIAAYDKAVELADVEYSYVVGMTAYGTARWAITEALNAYRVYKIAQDAVIGASLNTLEVMAQTSKDAASEIIDSVPAISGAGMTVNIDPRAMANTAIGSVNFATQQTIVTAKMTILNTQLVSQTILDEIENALAIVDSTSEYAEKMYSYAERFREALFAVNAAANELNEAVAKLNVCVEAYNAEVSKGETCLAEREAARRKQVNAIAQYRYNDMFFRLIRNEILATYTASFDLAQRYAFLAAQAYDYETAQLKSDAASGDAFKDEIIGARSLGELDDLLSQMDANWLVLKPRLGINNPQPYATWFSLRSECFRILPGEEGDGAWAKELTKYWVDDIRDNADFRRHCQPFQSQFGLKDKEPGLVIPFSTTIDFAKNLFGNDLAGGDSAYDSTWYATRIAAAGLWFDGYNAKNEGYTGGELLAKTPVAYLVPIGTDCLRVPGLDDESVLGFKVTDQVIPAPYAVGSSRLDDDGWLPTASDGDWGGADAAAKIRRHPSFRAYYGDEPTDDALDATRLVGRSVWNTKWLLVIPAGGMNADRDKALSVFINGSDVNRDGKLDLKPVRDIRLGFKTYSTSGN